MPMQYRSLIILFGVFIACHITCLLISIALFDTENYGEYHIFDDAISKLGMPYKNPRGEPFFCYAWAFLGCALVPFYHIFKHVLTLRSSEHVPFSTNPFRILRALGRSIHKHQGPLEWYRVIIIVICIGLFMLVQYPGLNEPTRFFTWDVEKNTLHCIGAGFLLIGCPTIQTIWGGTMEATYTSHPHIRTVGTYAGWFIAGSALVSAGVFGISDLVLDTRIWVKLRYKFEWAEYFSDVFILGFLIYTVDLKDGDKTQMPSFDSEELGGIRVGHVSPSFLDDAEVEVVEVETKVETKAAADMEEGNDLSQS
eukprot:gnl/Dysnectes_brevis/655_a723_3628.p1 GENE.gnl/Dysnectes_brevis/655_a723_3628~~gnl/Dysnectes_brevis/655_a723_3628.p1  ORF type:complete len:310 (+),score=89.44 gnl/Dysnectes_brevis/655_a723_3628:73-1002(+)